MPLDLEVMNDAAQQLIGKHDFSSFRSSSCGSKNPTKDIKTISLEQNGAFIIMNISATAFLHNMVRIIAGTLISISKGELTMTMTELLEAKDRNLAGKTVSAKGLFFLGPRYDKSTGIKSPYSNLKSKFNL
jgi:tRNA pseudouridine38-40 synthase